MNSLKVVCLVFLLVLVSMETSAIDVTAWNQQNGKGNTYVARDGSFATFERPAGCIETLASPRFNVLINKEAYVGLYAARNEWGATGNFGYFDFKNGFPIEIVVSCREDLGDYDILPHDADIYDVEKINDKILKFKVSRTKQNITIVQNGDYKYGEVLHLFCNDIDDNVPSINPEKTAKGGYFYDRDSKTYYFGPGYYDLEKQFGGTLTVSGGRNIYISPGAVLNGQVGISGRGSKIYGHGVVVQSKEGVGSTLNCHNCTQGEVSGAIFYRYAITGWQTTYTFCSNMNIRDIKIISVYGGCTDGMDFNGCHDMHLDNCFVRSDDDAVAIKGLGDENAAPNTCLPEENLFFNRMQLWSSANSGFNIGAETRASIFRNIQLTNSEILFSFDGINLNGSMDDRSALNICCLWGTYFEDILYENIYVNRCTRLIGATFKDSFWYGIIQGNQQWNGEMKNIIYRNVVCPNNTGENTANDILFLGWHQSYPMEKYPDGTPDKFIHDIYIDNVIIENEPIADEHNKHIITNNTNDLKLVYNMFFSYTNGIKELEDYKHYDDKWYTLDGRTVMTPKTGLYIHNGKKVIIK